MNKKDLQKLVRESIQEILAETTMSTIVNYKDKNRPDQVLDIDPSDTNTINKLKSDPNVSGLTVGPKKIKESEIDEMANVAVKYQLAPDVAAADFAGKKARIISAMQDTEEPMSKVEVASAMGYDKQNPINADFMDLVSNGAIVPAAGQTLKRLNRPAVEPGGEEGEEDGGEEGPEGGVAGDMSDEEIEASFAKAMKSGDEEPEEGDIEMGGVSGAKISDEDYEALMKFMDLENRLANVKSNLLKAKRYRSTPGDIADNASQEAKNLLDLKNRLQQKINDLVASSEYLQKSQQAKLAKAKGIEPAIEPEEEPLDEWVIGKMQYYAGIKP